jgi:hypothetical protein
MSRTLITRLQLHAAAALVFLGGCVTPAIVTSVDPQIGQLLASSAPSVIQLVSEQSVLARPSPPARLAAATPAILPVEPPRIALNQVVEAAPQQPTGDLWTLQRIKPLRDISLDIVPPKLVNDQQLAMAPPQDYAADALPFLAAEQPFTRGDLVAAGYEWHPSPEGLSFCYQPLYFEEVNLERYGHSFGVLQPVVSMAAFYGRIPALPYMVFARPARRCTYHAHWTLPGYKIPQWEPQPIVPSATGAAAELAVLYGIILLIP